MSGPVRGTLGHCSEHLAEAARLVGMVTGLPQDDQMLAEAQVHATIALTLATAGRFDETRGTANGEPPW
jgi:hypothetical protein